MKSKLEKWGYKPDGSLKKNKTGIMIIAALVLIPLLIGIIAVTQVNDDWMDEDDSAEALSEIEISELVEPGYLPEGYVLLDGSNDSYTQTYGNDPNDNITIEVAEGPNLYRPMKPSELDEFIAQNAWEESRVTYGGKEFRIETDTISPNNLDAYVIHKDYVIAVMFSTGDEKPVSQKQRDEFNDVLKNLKFAE